ncbi:MAG TPA: DUF1499 domain-containing protein [Candidatus Lokiarchaeia archaeon]|nr:DUF1499 domain-containing protein [Candidatus Lokiarchaeia archaeon]
MQATENKRSPRQLGVIDGQLAPPPKSPNCVSTQAEAGDKIHRMEPISYEGALEDVLAKLLSVAKAYPRTKLVKQEENYVHFEFRTKLFRFVDDVEFYLDDDAKLIHFRSASRIGYGDMGTNRKRMEALRKLYGEAPN